MIESPILRVNSTSAVATNSHNGFGQGAAALPANPLKSLAHRHSDRTGHGFTGRFRELFYKAAGLGVFDIQAHSIYPTPDAG